MSKQTKIVLNLTETTLNGRLRYRVFAKHGETVLHTDTLDLGSATARRRFLTALAEQAEQKSIPFDPAEYNALLQQRAVEADVESDKPGRVRDLAPKTILHAFKLHVLAEHLDGGVLLWSARTKKLYTFRPSSMRRADVLQAVGEAGAKKVWGGLDTPADGCYRDGEIIDAIATMAAETPRLGHDSLTGQGVWPLGDGYLVVNGGDAWRCMGQRWERAEHPKVEGRVIDFGGASDPWCPDLVERVEAMTLETASEVVTKLINVLGHWNWSHAADPQTVAGLVLATFVQACWPWRPQVSITGRSDSGKSTLWQEVLAPIFLRWHLMADRSTEAGLRQNVGNGAMPLLIDEFDKYRHRDQVLQLIRTSSRGGKVLRGTANQRGMEFGLRHIVWIAATESGLIEGPDKNRFIHLELNLPKRRGVLDIPGPSELTDLGRSLAAVAVWAVPYATKLAVVLRSHRIEEVPGRVVESFAVPAAMTAVANHGCDVHQDRAVEILHEMLEGRDETEEQGFGDEERLLQDILSAVVRVPEESRDVGGGKSSVVYVQRTVAQRLDDPQLFDDLEAGGVRLVKPRDDEDQRLFIATDVVRQHLLGPDWHGKVLDTLLLRLPDAQRDRQRCAGQRIRGVSLPLDAILDDSVPAVPGCPDGGGTT